MIPSAEAYLNHQAIGLLALFMVLGFIILMVILKAFVRLGERGVSALEAIPASVTVVSEKVTRAEGSQTALLLQLLAEVQSVHDKIDAYLLSKKKSTSPNSS